MTQNATLAVLGAGAWGTALANMAARGHAKVWLWSHDPAQVTILRETRADERRLPGVTLAENSNLSPTSPVLARPIMCWRSRPRRLFGTTAAAMRGHLRESSVVVSCAKGIEKETGLYMTEVLAEILPDQPLAALSGPSFAVDLARGLPTAVTLAAQKPGIR